VRFVPTALIVVALVLVLGGFLAPGVPPGGEYVALLVAGVLVGIAGMLRPKDSEQAEGSDEEPAAGWVPPDEDEDEDGGTARAHIPMVQDAIRSLAASSEEE
jgi:hypothetical protein